MTLSPVPWMTRNGGASLCTRAIGDALRNTSGRFEILRPTTTRSRNSTKRAPPRAPCQEVTTAAPLRRRPVLPVGAAVDANHRVDGGVRTVRQLALHLR